MSTATMTIDVAPAAARLWEAQQAANAANYAPDPSGKFPLHSCSVEGHAGAAAFRTFLRAGLPIDRWLRLLDIGCGPQPVPSYLAGYPMGFVWGIDPLPPAQGEHPFVFEQGYAEQLPWRDGIFNVVVGATSFDHLLDPVAALREAWRVLEPGGALYLWATLRNDAPRYDPQAPPAALADDCHVYHLGDWFLEGLETAGFLRVRSALCGADTFLECHRP